MKKIAFVLGSMGRGGAERVISILSKSYAERGYQTDIIVLLSDEVGYELHPKTQIVDFSGKTSSRLKRLPFWIKSIRSYVKMEKPDVVVSFTARISIITKLALAGLKTRLVVSERNDPRCDGRSKIVDVLTKLQYPTVNKVVFQTKRAADYFPNLKNSIIIPNPITVECVASKRTEGKIVTVGRLMAQKNQKMLIEAFSEVAKKNDKAFLEIYGSGELEEALEEQIVSLNLTDRVFLKGNVTDVHQRIADAEVFCLSSDYEGLSNALLEAMMMGLPCISTNCAGADEYIKNGENGLIVEVGDKEEFVVAIERLLDSSRMRESFSKRAKETSVAFSSKNVMDAWDEIIIG